MKKRKRFNRFTGLFLTTALLFAMCINFTAGGIAVAMTTENETRINHSNDWVKSDGSYGFPESLRHEKGYLIGTQDQIQAATQMPDNILKTISTEELISLILDYPLLPYLHAYQTVEEGYQIIKPNFNGFSELLSREDAFSKLIEAYDNYSIPSEKIMDWDSLSQDNFVDEFNRIIRDKDYIPLVLADGAVYTSIDILEMLIYDLIGTNKNASNMDRFTESYIDKLGEKIDSAYFDDVNPAMLLVHMIETEDDNALEDCILEKLSITSIEVEPQDTSPMSITAQSIPAVYNSNYPITTPRGNTAYVILDPNIQMGSYSVWAPIISVHPTASLVSLASTTLNCHSYAWLSRQFPGVASTTDMNYQNMWLNFISPFTTDGYYTEISSPTVGCIATWNAHSGIITIPIITYVTSGPEHKMISKWAAGPMVSHNMRDCPYYDSHAVEYYTW